MNPKRIFVLNGHPAKTSLNGSLAEAYIKSAREAGHEVRSVELHDLDFDLDFENGNYENYKPLEPELEAILESLEWCEHFVLTTPMWWGGLPAKLKGLFDRTFIPGRTFNTRETTMFGLPKPMLNGRTGHLFVTSDTPGWFFRLKYGNGLFNQVGKQIFEFVGIKPARITHFSGASHPKEGQIDGWINKIQNTAMVAH